MKVINSVKINELIISEIDKPKIQSADDVLIKIEYVGVCGSDIHYYRNGKIGDQVISYPFRMGHECSGVIEEIGSSVNNVKRGDLVAVDPLVSCGYCQQCLDNREHTCLNQNFLGCPGQLEGCLAEYIVLPAKNCFPVPQNINPEIAVLVEPLSIGYYSVEFIKNISKIKSAAILGSGPIGLSVALFLKARGMNAIFMTDKLNYRLLAAKKTDAVWTGNPCEEDVVSKLITENPSLFDVVFECCGKQDALDQAVDILKPGGLLILVGIPETDCITFNIGKIRRKEITIQNVRRQNNSIAPVIDLIASGKISPGFMITHKFDFTQTKDAFELVANYDDNVIKALIKF